MSENGGDEIVHSRRMSYRISENEIQKEPGRAWWEL